MENWNLEEMDERIQQMRHLAEELKHRGEGIQAVERNVDRILASIKMLELNITDMRGLL